MIEVIATGLSATLIIIGLIHAYWASGGIWPGTDEPSLAKTVVGTNGITKMPPRPLTAAVSFAILLAAVWPLMWAGLISYPLPQSLVWLGMYVLAGIFLLRGIAGYLPVFRNSQTEEPFSSLDKRYFSPLCLLLGAGFVSIIVLATT